MRETVLAEKTFCDLWATSFGVKVLDQDGFLLPGETPCLDCVRISGRDPIVKVNLCACGGDKIAGIKTCVSCICSTMVERAKERARQGMESSRRLKLG